MALRTPSGACQKRRSIAYRREGVFFPIENALYAGKGGWECTVRVVYMISTIALLNLWFFQMLITLCYLLSESH